MLSCEEGNSSRGLKGITIGSDHYYGCGSHFQRKSEEDKEEMTRIGKRGKQGAVGSRHRDKGDVSKALPFLLRFCCFSTQFIPHKDRAIQ